MQLAYEAKGKGFYTKDYRMRLIMKMIKTFIKEIPIKLVLNNENIFG